MTRVAVVVAAWLVVLGTATGLTLAALGSLRHPEPILQYDAAQLTSAVPAAPAAVARPGRSAGATVVDPAWVQRTATETGLPVAAVRAYATASLRLGQEQPGCRLGWSTLAGIAEVESV